MFDGLDEVFLEDRRQLAIARDMRRALHLDDGLLLDGVHVAEVLRQLRFEVSLCHGRHTYPVLPALHVEISDQSR
jgi:hypothetical protein